MDRAVRRIDRGYVAVKCQGHPRARNGYVHGHVLVMEKHIGYSLQKT